MQGTHEQWERFGLTLGQFACLNTSGSSEPTEKRGALNPEFVCWLMGYPPEWLSCAPSAMPSTSGRRSVHPGGRLKNPLQPHSDYV